MILVSHAMNNMHSASNIQRTGPMHFISGDLPPTSEARSIAFAPFAMTCFSIRKRIIWDTTFASLTSKDFASRYWWHQHFFNKRLTNNNVNHDATRRLICSFPGFEGHEKASWVSMKLQKISGSLPPSLGLHQRPFQCESTVSFPW